MWIVRLRRDISKASFFGPFEQNGQAKRFAAFLVAEVGPADVLPLTSPIDAALRWHTVAVDTGSIITPPTYLVRLRDVVREKGGVWTTLRAVEELGAQITPERARQILNQLAGEGLLVKHGVRGKLWTSPAVGA